MQGLKCSDVDGGVGGGEQDEATRVGVRSLQGDAPQ